MASGRTRGAAAATGATAVKGKAIRDADLREKMAFFEGYGALCGDAGIPHLDNILNGKGFLGRREDPEIRACAAMALGREPQRYTAQLGDGMDIERRAAEIEHKRSQARLNDRKETFPAMPAPAGVSTNGHRNGQGAAGDEDVEVM